MQRRQSVGTKTSGLQQTKPCNNSAKVNTCIRQDK